MQKTNSKKKPRSECAEIETIQREFCFFGVHVFSSCAKSNVHLSVEQNKEHRAAAAETAKHAKMCFYLILIQ